jgi:hypothetical protein
MIWALSDCLLCFRLSGWDAVSTNHRISYNPGLAVKMAPLVLEALSLGASSPRSASLPHVYYRPPSVPSSAP